MAASNQILLSSSPLALSFLKRVREKGIYSPFPLSPFPFRLSPFAFPQDFVAADESTEHDITHVY
jgi:hypothetical protein